MARKPIQEGPEEGGRLNLPHGVPQASPASRTIEPPGPVDEDFARMEARVRTKMEMREPLTREEREFLAHQPGDRDVKYQ